MNKFFSVVTDLFLRLSLFLVFFTGAYEKFIVAGIPAFAAKFHLSMPMAYASALFELCGSVGIILGLLIAKKDTKGIVTRISGVLIAIIMIGAIATVKWSAFQFGFFAGIKNMYSEIPLLAIALYYSVRGNA